MTCELAPCAATLVRVLRGFPIGAGLAFAWGASALMGCTPVIGDHCTLSTDCSVQGTRICDTSQPAGYCTQLGCSAGTCPDNAACVEVNASVPGCPYDDYTAPSRIGRPMCMKTCSSDSDCRQADGYTCVSLCSPNPEGGACVPNPSLVVLENNQSERVCMIAGPVPSVATSDVCSAKFRTEAGPLDLGAVAEAGGGEDAGGDVAEAGVADAGGEGDVAPLDGSGDSRSGDGSGDSMLGGDSSDAAAIDGSGDATLGDGSGDATLNDGSSDATLGDGSSDTSDAGAADAADAE